ADATSVLTIFRPTNGVRQARPLSGTLSLFSNVIHNTILSFWRWMPILARPCGRPNGRRFRPGGRPPLQWHQADRNRAQIRRTTFGDMTLAQGRNCGDSGEAQKLLRRRPSLLMICSSLPVVVDPNVRFLWCERGREAILPCLRTRQIAKPFCGAAQVAGLIC